MVNIATIIIGFLTFYWQIYCFGWAILRPLITKTANKTNHHQNKHNCLTQLKALEKILLSIVLGLSLNASLIFLLGQLISTKAHLLGFLFGLIGLFHSRAGLKLICQAWRNEILAQKTSWLLIALGSTFFFLTIGLTYFDQHGNLIYQHGQWHDIFHDSFWHLALAQKLKQAIPPVHPGSFLFKVSNYHYFYDLIIANFSLNYGLELLTLYFQVWPLIIAWLLGLASFCLMRRLQPKATEFFLFLVYFTGSLGFLVPFFIPGRAGHESIFWVSQTFVMMVNPQVIVSFVLLLTGLWLCLGWLKTFNQQTKQLNLSYPGLIFVLAASSLGFKSYSFVLLSFLIGLLLGWLLIKKQLALKQVLFLGLGYSLSCLPFIVTLLDLSRSSFFFKPFWFLDSLVEDPNRLYLPIWKQLADQFYAQQAWWPFLKIKFKELIIFYLGNLGLRASLIFLPLLLKTKKIRLNLNEPQRLIINLASLGFILCSVLPMLFLQTGVVWNSIQFFYYSLILADLLAALVLATLWEKIRPNPLSKISFGLLMLIIALPTTLGFAQEIIFNPKQISAEKIQLVSQFQPSDRILICPEETQLYQTSLLVGLTGSQVYLADPVTLLFLGVDAGQIEQELSLVFEKGLPGTLQELMTNFGLNYLLCSGKALKKTNLNGRQ